MVVRIPGSEHEILAARPIEASSGDGSVTQGQDVVSEEHLGVNEQVCNREALRAGRRGEERDHACDYIGLAVLGAVWTGLGTFCQGGGVKLSEEMAGEETGLGGG